MADAMHWYYKKLLKERVKMGSAYLHPQQVVCPECGAEMVLRQTLKFSHSDGSPRKFYGCSRWPDCKATHGAHPDGRPLGTPADSATKEARILAHEAFDPVWKKPASGLLAGMTREEAYEWLSIEMGIPFGDCHIGMFTKEQCEKVIYICTRREPV